MSLQAAVALRMGTLAVDAELAAASGQVIGLLGPNAAGKTTVLRALAGLSPLGRGRVVLDDEVLEDTATGVRVPPDKRRIGVVFQDYLLFPHLSALDNVAFGLRARGVSRAQARQRAAEWLARLGLAEQFDARPRALSGGQAQRVALARALVTDPRLLLLDEPLAALDAGARAELRRELRRHLASFAGTSLLVTHDPLEAMTLADQLVILEDGRVTQTGTPERVSAHPRSRYVAELVGLNLFRGRASDGAIALADGHVLVAADEHHYSGEVFAVVAPADRRPVPPAAGGLSAQRLARHGRGPRRRRRRRAGADRRSRPAGGRGHPGSGHRASSRRRRSRVGVGQGRRGGRLSRLRLARHDAGPAVRRGPRRCPISFVRG